MTAFLAGLIAGIALVLVLGAWTVRNDDRRNK